MRGVVLRAVMLFLIAAMFGGHITELFDRWDHTARTGQDSDYTVVVIAACAALVFVAAKVSRLFCRAPKIVEALGSMFQRGLMAAVRSESFAFDLSPPPLTPIRI
jgi:uncharacterized membrane protein SpoIIM required for sporulation